MHDGRLYNYRQPDIEGVLLGIGQSGRKFLDDDCDHLARDPGTVNQAEMTVVPLKASVRDCANPCLRIVPDHPQQMMQAGMYRTARCVVKEVVYFLKSGS